jgi:hypothetical protein
MSRDRKYNYEKGWFIDVWAGSESGVRHGGMKQICEQQKN